LQVTTLKNDLNKAMRVISKEVGDNVDIDAVNFRFLYTNQ